TYTVLTVGDGLVSQIPALIISTAAGIVVTRTASESNLGREVVSQIFSNPRAIFVTSGVLLFLAVAPGLPTVPFLLMAAATGFIGYRVSSAQRH
ncbi:MAG: FHIPEP family type III secretion protein, partial [Candidatus Oleimicrobiaceae bacterium]